MKFDCDKELKKLKVKEGLLAMVGGMGLGLLFTVFKNIGKQEFNLKAIKLVDKIIENTPQDN